MAPKPLVSRVARARHGATIKSPPAVLANAEDSRRGAGTILRLSQSPGVASMIKTDDRPAFFEHITTAGEILSLLESLVDIEHLIDEYFSFSQTALVPEQLILGLITAIRNSSTFANRSSDLGFYEAVLKSSASDVTIAPNLDVEGFCTLFSGDKLCVEAVGFLCSLSARSALYRLARGTQVKDDFIQKLVRCSNLSLRLARDLATQPNDVIIWLGYDNLQLMTLIEGEANKVFSTVFDRPPRISRRHIDCKPPLDISDEALFAPAILAQEQRKLTEDGWNLKGYRSTSWARIRYMLGEFREKVEEYQPRSRQTTTEAELRYSQDNLPPNGSSAVCLMLAKVYLTYLYIDFQIYRIIDKNIRSNPPEIFQVSWTMLETVLHMASMRNSAGFTPRDLPGINYYKLFLPTRLKAYRQVQIGRS
ncbi:hypothetical protein EYZ11_008093 [Aspergillus tanneri]|uniref:Uncharacterized protein n=1 Tax=Aspergillus tanneri TaxID=1220188 RepID=A0A4S3JGY2_9EURO|nr:hypothetical protein EYZ11_008093 [Aspergillus tanneri]